MSEITVSNVTEMIPAVPVAPTQEQIDELAKQYFLALEVCTKAETCFKSIEKKCIEQVQTWGIVPAKAENSRRLDGQYNTLTVTVGNTTSIDDARVQHLKNALTANKFGAIFDNLFKERTRHEAVKGAAIAILAAGMPKRLTEKISTLYARCFSTEKKAPSLKVKQIVEKPEKKPRGKKGGK